MQVIFIVTQTVSSMLTNSTVVCVDGHDEIDPLRRSIQQDLSQYDALCHHDVEQLSLEIEKERLGSVNIGNLSYQQPILL